MQIAYSYSFPLGMGRTSYLFNLNANISTTSNKYNIFVISEDFFFYSYTKSYIIENEPTTCKHCSLCLSRVIIKIMTNLSLDFSVMKNNLNNQETPCKRHNFMFIKNITLMLCFLHIKKMPKPP